ncbi:MAG: NAD(P)H-dependent glycerol-3-phosphate dehydrogenase [Planctomycetota bacterium]
MKVAVLGDGGWGTALALLLHGAGAQPTLWGAFPEYVETLRQRRVNEKFLAGVELPSDLAITADPEEAMRGAELVVSVAPTQFLSSVIEKVRPALPEGVPIVSASKGIENETLRLPTTIWREALDDGRPLAVLSGPSHAEEVARRLPASVVVGAEDQAVAERVQGVCSTDRFRIYTSPDPIGVELGGALKNPIAVAAGMIDGLGFGDNAKSALLTRGAVEIARLGQRLGARRETFFGLSGIGDLATTCFSRHSRNRSVGERIGRGERLQDILASTEKVAEGVWTARSVHGLAQRLGVELPIIEQVYCILFEDLDPNEAVTALMTRSHKAEVEELD